MAETKATIKQQLAQAKENLMNLLNSLSEEQWNTLIFSEGDEWRVRDIVAHLVETETGMSIQVHKIRQGRETIPEDFDLNQWNAGLKKRMGEKTSAELLARLDQVRSRTLENLETIEDSEWSLTGRHPAWGVISIKQYYKTIAGHQRQHTQDIKKGLAI